MKAHVIDNTDYLDAKGKLALKNLIKLVLKSLKLPRNTEVCLSFIHDADIRVLNRTYRNIDRATDVLSFQQYDIDQESVQEEGGVIAAIAKYNQNNTKDSVFPLGDIVISIDTAQRHAVKYRNTLDEEIRKLIIHGILHLLGYDHKKKKDAEFMRTKEKELAALITDL